MASYELEQVELDDAGIAVVALTGELDLTNAEELLGHLRTVANGKTPLVVDLNRVAFIDSAAIHHLFELARERGRGALAFVVDPSAAVAGTLEIVELDRAASVTASLADAKAALSRLGSG